MVLFIVKGIKGVREMKKNSTGVPADLDPPKFGPPGPNSLADLDPRGTQSASGFGPPM